MNCLQMYLLNLLMPFRFKINYAGPQKYAMNSAALVTWSSVKWEGLAKLAKSADTNKSSPPSPGLKTEEISTPSIPTCIIQRYSDHRTLPLQLHSYKRSLL